MKLFEISKLSRSELALVLGGSLLFLLIQYFIVGLMPAQILMVALFIGLYLAHPVSRIVAVVNLDMETRIRARDRIGRDTGTLD